MLSAASLCLHFPSSEAIQSTHHIQTQGCSVALSPAAHALHTGRAMLLNQLLFFPL